MQPLTACYISVIASQACRILVILSGKKERKKEREREGGREGGREEGRKEKKKKTDLVASEIYIASSRPARAT
jgi:hypothetical protein